MGFGKQNTTIFFVGSFCLGIASYFLLGQATAIFLLAITALIGFIFSPRKVLVLFCCVLILLGYMRADIWNNQHGTGLFDSYIEQEITFTGLVDEEPDLREHNTRIIVSIEDTHNRVLVVVPRYPEFEYGQIVSVTGELQGIENFENETGRVFDYQNYLKKDRVYYQMFYPGVETVGAGEGSFIKSNLLGLKHVLLNQINRVLPEPNASLLGGLLVGAKSSMGSELLDDFRETGVIHIVVLSGFNVTIVAEFFVRIFAFLGLAASSTLATLSIFFFAILTGASATIVRASIMAVLVIVARVTGRANDVTKALFIAGGLMLAHNPMLLLYDPSFQLSFMATLGLIVLVPWLEKKLVAVPRGWFDFRGLIAASLAAQIFVTPLLVWMMGEVSIVSPIVNILILWVVPPVMFTGFIMVLLSFISSLVAFPPTLISHYILSYILKIVDIFTQIPFASVVVPKIPFWFVGVVYIIFFLIYFCAQKGISIKKIVRRIK